MPFGMRVMGRAAETGRRWPWLRALPMVPASRRSIDVHDLPKGIRRPISPSPGSTLLTAEITVGPTVRRAAVRD
jgi:hypothetical protein